MAPILNLPSGYAQASLHFGGTALPLGATMTFGFLQLTTGDTPAGAGAAIVSLLRATGGPFVVTNTNYSNSATFIDVLVKFGPLATGPAATVAAGGVLGNVTGDAAPPSQAALINKSTNTGGRKGRGRMFSPGLAEGTVTTGGYLVAGTLTGLQSAWTQFRAAMESAGRPLYVLHRYDPAKGETPLAPSGVISLDVQSLTATQRQRMRR
jgi:hypothetical protein